MHPAHASALDRGIDSPSSKSTSPVMKLKRNRQYTFPIMYKRGEADTRTLQPTMNDCTIPLHSTSSQLKAIVNEEYLVPNLLCRSLW
jgi:hypothetical protein